MEGNGNHSVGVCDELGMSLWDKWVEETCSYLESKNLLRTLLPIQLPVDLQIKDDEIEVFDGLRQWDRAAVEVDILDSTFQGWVRGDFHASPGDNDIHHGNGETDNETQQFKKLILFSSNDYLGLSSHPAVCKAAAKAAQEHGMGPRGSTLMCGYNSYHIQLETCLADLTKKEDCLMCPTGFSANLSFMTTIAYIGSLLATSKTPSEEEKVAIFSDAFNHASIIDGTRLADRQGSAKVYVYKHCDMDHLDELMSKCPSKKKVVITDSVFSMDGDFAPFHELAELRKKHGFLLVVDEAHGTLICGKNGGGATEEFGCENDVDIIIGTLSKAAGGQGGFIACSKRWKQLLQSRGRAFMFSSSAPVPIVAAGLAAIAVAKKETWRKTAIWDRVQEFKALTGIPVKSPIIIIIVGSEDKALQISRYLLVRGFHTIAIRPPVVPSHLCRLRVSLSAAHTSDDVKRLASAILEWQNLKPGDNTIQGSMPSSTM